MRIGKPLEDLVVVVPGILGSRLARIDSAGADTRSGEPAQQR
jgi:hypothetical protein